MSGIPALEVTNLNKKFGSVTAAKNINIRFAEGEVVSIIGTNGAGKTTFINMVTGYVNPDAGTVCLFGKDITGWPPRKVVGAGLGRSFQIPQLFEGISVWENLMTAAVVGDLRFSSAFSRAEQPEMELRCERMLRRMEFTALKDELPEALSGGTRKLLDIMMAVISGPRLLLLDEPTSGVSEQEKSGLMEKILYAVEGESMTTILVEHDMDVVRRFSERVLAFVAGEVAADGVPEDVFAHPKVKEAITGNL